MAEIKAAMTAAAQEGASEMGCMAGEEDAGVRKVGCVGLEALVAYGVKVVRAVEVVRAGVGVAMGWAARTVVAKGGTSVIKAATNRRVHLGCEAPVARQ